MVVVFALLAGQLVDVDIKLVNMGRGLRDRSDGDGHDSRHSRPGYLWQGKGRQGKQRAVAKLPGGSGQRLCRHLPEQVQLRPADEKEQGGGDAAGQSSQKKGKLSKHAFQIAGKEDGGQKRNQRYHPYPAASAYALHSLGRRVGKGVPGQGQADDHGDRAGDGGRKDPLYRLVAAETHQKSGGDGHQSGQHDSELCVGNKLCGKNSRSLKGSDLLRRTFCRHHAGDGCQIGEGRTVVHRDFPAGNQNEADGGKAAGENGRGDLKASDQRHGNRGRKHDDNLLNRVQQKLDEGGPLIGQIAHGGLCVGIHWVVLPLLKNSILDAPLPAGDRA